MQPKQPTVPQEIDFPQYNMKCSGGNVILRGIFHVVLCFPLNFMLYRGNLYYFSNSPFCSDKGTLKAVLSALTMELQSKHSSLLL